MQMMPVFQVSPDREDAASAAEGFKKIYALKLFAWKAKDLDLAYGKLNDDHDISG